MEVAVVDVYNVVGYKDSDIDKHGITTCTFIEVENLDQVVIVDHF